MSADALIEGLPDLVVLIRRDGVVLECGGGHGVPGLRCRLDAAGKRIESLWPAPVAEFLKLLMRRSLALRTTAEARLEHDGIAYEARASARGPERALCIIRQASASSRDDSLEGSDERPRPQLDRRGFLRRCKESMAMAALRERPLAVAVIQLDGISDIAQIIATKVSEQIMSTAILRLPAKSDERDGKPWWYLGQLSESLLALVLESADREAIGECVAGLSASLREPIAIGGAEFHLTPYAGVAILGQDASTPKLLLDHARAAATEARRRGSSEVCFFTDTMRLESPARLDIARDPLDLHDLARLGARVVVDEVARGMGSLELLARAPLWGLQLDRAWVTGLRRETQSRKVCQAGIAVAQAFGLTPIASGVDDSGQREALLALGCRYGSGDLFRDAAPDITAPARAAVGA